MARRLVFLITGLLMGIAPSVAAAQEQVRTSLTPEQLVPESDKPALAKLYAVFTIATPAGQLAALDSMLVSQPGPTAMRGLIQDARAGLLDAMERLPEARAAGDDAVRSLPNWAPAKLAGFDAFVFVPDPAAAADRWMLASKADPVLANDVSNYTMNALTDRLDEAGDRLRADNIRSRLVDTGYAKGSLQERSNRAFSVLKTRLAAGDTAGALAAIPSISAPDDAAEVLADRRYQGVWDTMQIWAGPKLIEQWSSFIELNQQSWDASHSIEAALAYARALKGNGDYATIIEELPDYLSADAITSDQAESPQLAALVARALVQTGRGGEAIAYLSGALAKWPKSDEVQGLNLLANLGALQHETGDYTDALKTFDKVDDIVRRDREGINSGARYAIAHAEVCTAHDAHAGGRATDALGLLEVDRHAAADSYLGALLCLERFDDARAFAISLLRDPDTRPTVLRLMQQKWWDRETEVDRREADAYERLAHDPALLRAIAPYGRVLGYPVSGVTIKTSASS